MSDLVNVQRIICASNQLVNLDVSSCGKMTELYCENNPTLTNIDLSSTYALDTLNCFGSNLQSLDISSCTNTTYVDARFSPLAEIVVWWLAGGPVPNEVQFLYSGSPIIRNP